MQLALLFQFYIDTEKGKEEKKTKKLNGLLGLGGFK
jgi:hypothetical protein